MTYLCSPILILSTLIYHWNSPRVCDALSSHLTLSLSLSSSLPPSPSLLLAFSHLPWVGSSLTLSYRPYYMYEQFNTSCDWKGQTTLLEVWESHTLITALASFSHSWFRQSLLLPVHFRCHQLGVKRTPHLQRPLLGRYNRDVLHQPKVKHVLQSSLY